MNDYPKIAIVIPYFGTWPEWFPLFLKSCQYNPEIDWILVSDLKIKCACPANVKLFDVGLGELTERISQMFGLEVQIKYPYKLTDFKPAFGCIFSDYLSSYAFWGYGDMDLIYGKLNHFLSPGLFARYDIISPSRDFFPGHFLLLRNTDPICNFFRRARDWKKIFNAELCFSFDEKNNNAGIRPEPEIIQTEIFRQIENHLLEYKTGRNQLLSMLNKLIGSRWKKNKYSRVDLNDFNSILNQAARTGEIKAFQAQLYCDDVIYRRDRLKGTVSWNEGILRLDKKEIMYYHFQMSKYSGIIFEEKEDDSFALNFVSPEKSPDFPDDNEQEGFSGKRAE